jgi:hypothetical protein
MQTTVPAASVEVAQEEKSAYMIIETASEQGPALETLETQTSAQATVTTYTTGTFANDPPIPPPSRLEEVVELKIEQTSQRRTEPEASLPAVQPRKKGFWQRLFGSKGDTSRP